MIDQTQTQLEPHIYEVQMHRGDQTVFKHEQQHKLASARVFSAGNRDTFHREETVELE